MKKLKEYISLYKERIEEVLEDFLTDAEKEAEDFFNKLVYSEIKRFTLSPGKRLRPILVIAGYKGVKGDVPDHVVKASTIFELLHSYLLIHDDVVDRDPVRRNQPTVWKNIADKLGLNFHHAASLAIFAGDITRTLIDKVIKALPIPHHKKEAVYSYVHKIDRLTNYGQVVDVSLSLTPLEKLRKDDILKVYYYKTALYTLNGPLGLGALLADADKNLYREYAVPVGIAFQIKDDILGTFGDPEKTGKPTNSDIKEGKRTLLLYYAWHYGGKKDREILKNVVGNPNASEEEIEAVREVFRKTGALEKAESSARVLVEEGKEALKRLDIDPEVKDALREFADYIITREK